MTRRRLLLFLGPVFSALFLWIALRNASLSRAWETLRGVDFRLLALPVVITLANFSVRAWRWQLLFPPASRPRFWTAFRALTISFAANNLLPGRAGDLGRCVLVGRRTSVSDTTIAAGTLVVEKLFDALLVVVIVCYALLALSPERWLWQLTAVSIAILIATFAVLLVIRLRAEWAGRLLHRAAARNLPGAASMASLLDSFQHGVAAVSSPSAMLTAFCLTLAIWTTEALLFYVFGRSLGIVLTAGGSLIACAILGLGLMIPAAPGALGTYEFFGSSALRLVGVPASPALALILLLHAWVLVFNTAFGLVAMAAGGIGFSSFSSPPPEVEQSRGVVSS